MTDLNIPISKIFTDENQDKWAHHYWKLCNRAITRELPTNVYVEQHHIFPLCVFGKTTFVVNLTPEEHYIAHQLLVKMYPDNVKLIYAAGMMGGTRSGNKIYGWLRRKMSEAYKGKTNSNETKLKMSLAQKGKTKSTEARRKMSEAHKDRTYSTRSAETRQKMSNASKGKPKSEEHRRKLSEVMKGKPKSNEARLKMSESSRGRPSPHKDHPHSAIARQKISNAKKGVPWSAARRAAQENIILNQKNRY